MKHSEVVKRVEEIVGMGRGAWDCINAEEISKAFFVVFKQAASPSPPPVQADAEKNQPDCNYCGVGVYSYCPRCGKKRTA